MLAKTKVRNLSRGHLIILKNGFLRKASSPSSLPPQIEVGLIEEEMAENYQQVVRFYPDEAGNRPPSPVVPSPRHYDANALNMADYIQWLQHERQMRWIEEQSYQEQHQLWLVQQSANQHQ